jgi:hypothetical protein
VIDQYLTPDSFRLGLSGLAAGVLVGIAWRVVGRVRWGAAPFVLAVLVAARSNGRNDWPHWSTVLIAGGLVTTLAAFGGARLLVDPSVRWEWVAAGALASAAGVWVAVPETGPAILVGGALGGLASSSVVTRCAWSPGAGFGIAAILGWAALSGAAGRPWAAVGGALCAGVAPWVALRPFLPTFSCGRHAGGVLFAGHVVLVIAAARWIGVVPQAGWHRVMTLGFAGMAVGMAAHRRA